MRTYLHFVFDILVYDIKVEEDLENSSEVTFRQLLVAMATVTRDADDTVVGDLAIHESYIVYNVSMPL